MTLCARLRKSFQFQKDSSFNNVFDLDDITASLSIPTICLLSLRHYIAPSTSKGLEGLAPYKVLLLPYAVPSDIQTALHSSCEVS